MAESDAKKSTHAGARIGFDEQYFSSLLAPSDAERLKVVYRTAIRTARPWYRQKYGPLPEKASLDFFEDLLGFHVSERFGLGLVGNRSF